MKKIMTIVLAATFALGAVAACSDPCTKVADKAIECLENDKAKETMKKDKDKTIKTCKESEDLKKLASKCSSIKDCKKFNECLAGGK